MDDLGKGWEHQRAGRLADAVACYRRFLADHPDHAEGWALLGLAAFRQRDLEEAVGCYLRSLALKPDSADVLTNLGVAHAVRGDYAAAEQALRRAVALRPLSVDAQRNLAQRAPRPGQVCRSR